MAYFITDLTSGKFYPANNAINFTVNSASSGACNFRYVARIYINNTLVFTSKLFPEPTTGYGFFQISRIIQDWITNTISKTPYTKILNYGAGTSTPDSLLSVYVKIGEEYDNTSGCTGTVTSYLDQSTSSTIYVFNAAIPYEDFPTWDQNKYLVTSAAADIKFLTNSPRTLDITFNDSYYLDFLTTATITGSSYVVSILYYDETGYNIGGYDVTGTLPLLRRRHRIACGPFDINKEAKTNTSITPLDSSVSYYTVQMHYIGSHINRTITEMFTFKVKPAKEFSTRLAWVNQMGGIDHFTFYHRNNKSYDITRKTFKKTLNTNYSNSLGYQVGDRQDTTYAVAATEKHSVSTYCQRSQAAWLNELYLSPDVWTYKYGFNYDDYAVGSYYIMGDYVRYAGGVWKSVSVSPIIGSDPAIGNTDWSYVSIADEVQITNPCDTANNWYMLPIVVTNNTVKEEQKTTKPILYSLDYVTGYTKNILKG